MGTNLLTFASSNMSRSSRRIVLQAKDLRYFDNIFSCSEKDLDSEFREKFRQKLKVNVRGFGYWCWKPQIITQTLKQLPENDTLLYVDAGCHLNPRGLWRLKEYFAMVEASNAGILAFQAREPEPPFPYDGRWLPDLREKYWTKGDVLDYFGVRDCLDVINSQSIGAGIVFFRNCETAHSILQEWKAVFEQDFGNIDDSPSKSENLPGFKGHRHDQSIFSVLAKLRGVSTVSAYEYWYPQPNTKQPDWEVLKNYPILAKRDKEYGFTTRAKEKIKKKLKKFFPILKNF
jgi:hypothetical protein